MHIIGRRWTHALVLSVALAGAGALRAQEESGEGSPEALFKSAREAYDAKRYGKALDDVKLLVNALWRLRVDQVKRLLPAAPAGWTAEDATGDPSGAVLMGMGVAVKRHYQRGETSVDVEMLCDSPMVGMVAPMITNPMLIQGNPALSIVTVGGRRCLLEYHADGKSGSLQMLLNGNTTLLKIGGSGVEKKDLTETFGKAVDAKAIEAALQS